MPSKRTSQRGSVREVWHCLLLGALITSGGCAPGQTAAPSPGIAPLETAPSETKVAGDTSTSDAGVSPATETDVREPRIRSLALRVHNMDSMLAFYRDAFGVEFREVDTFGILSQFGTLAGITLKLVPIRGADDFVGYPDLQIGLEVESIDTVLEIAARHGGRADGIIRRESDRLHGAVRDPDGNTIELYQPIDD